MTVPDGASSISVAVRVRPFTIREAAQLAKIDDGPLFLGDGSLAAAPTPKLAQKGLRSVIKVVDDRCLVFDPPEDNPMQKFSKSVVPNGKRVKDQTFVFDKVFDQNTTQCDVYESTTRSLLDNVLDGYNATVFAYGATGCGKTHTITGTAQQPGIIFLTMQELFEKINELQQDKVIELSLSYLEIYNETIRDLLVPGGSKQGLMLREDAHQAVSVAGLSSHHPQSVQEVMDMIVRGNEYRTMSPTEANATSSRSHAVLQINVSQKDRNADISEPHTMATLSIIDLAGSERASATKNRGERLIEGANINKSLLALGSCINALCDPRKRNHVPYRNSKLTRLLKFSLGGNCKTVMIVCVSPSSAHFDETQNTLRYANRAKNIQTKVTRNVYNVNRHVKDFLKKIDEQMALINELKQQQKDYEGSAFAKFRKQTEKRDAIFREAVARIRAAYEHSAGERQERINMMKKLRQIERRISLISTWIAGFDTVCETREDEDPPANLVTIRKTAQGVLSEFESSRQHYHQRLGKNNWERALDSALQTGIRQLKDVDCGQDGIEISGLQREVELLKSIGTREAYLTVLDQEKGGDAAIVQTLLQAHFDTVAILGQILVMSEPEAVQAAKTLLGKIVSACTAATSQVIKPEGGLPVTEIFPPTRAGTPKRRKAAANLLGPSPIRPFAKTNPAYLDATAAASASPAKGSPARRRKLGAAKKAVSFTPRKKSPHKAAKRGVRWKDDADNGPLAEFQATPQPVYSTPNFSSEDAPSPPKLVREDNIDQLGSSPLPTPPESGLSAVIAQGMVDGKPPIRSTNRFQAGFLSKKNDGGSGSGGSANGSPLSTIPTSSALAFSSDSDDPSPLREIAPNRAPHMSSSHLNIVTNAANSSEVTPADNHSSSDNDEKPRAISGNAASRAASFNRAEAKQIRSAMKRHSSLTGCSHHGQGANHVSASATPNSTTGSMVRTHRRRSPTASSGSPPSTTSENIMSAGMARRMGARSAGSEIGTLASVLSPRSAPIVKSSAGARRMTSVDWGSGGGGGGGVQRDGAVSRQSGARVGGGVVSGGGFAGRGSWAAQKRDWR